MSTRRSIRSIFEAILALDENSTESSSSSILYQECVTNVNDETSEIETKDIEILSANLSSREFSTSLNNNESNHASILDSPRGNSSFSSDNSSSSSRSNFPAVKNSGIWKHFDSKTITIDSASCVHCNAVIKRNGNTTNLWSHLEKKHKSIWLNLRGTVTHFNKNNNVAI